MSKTNFPFETADVLALLGYSFNSNKEAVYIPCPYCGGKKKPLNIRLDSSVFRCNKTPSHSGNILTLYRDQMGLKDTKEAYHDIIDKLNLGNTLTPTMKKVEEKVKVEIPVRSISEIDDVNRRIFEKSFLSKKHAEALRARGFSDEGISTYRTLPERTGKEIYEFVKSLHINDITGYPGFFLSKKDAPMLFHWKRGIMVPYRSFHNKIYGIQVRMDDDVRTIDEDGKMEHKYYWITSRDKKSGTAQKQCVGYAGKFLRNESGEEYLHVPNGTLVWTEGAMKGDLFTHLTEQPCAAIPGINALNIIKNEIPMLKEYGIHTMLLGFDMDRMYNVNVMLGISEIEKLFLQEGFSVKCLSWCTDYLNTDGSKEKLNTEKMFVFTVQTLNNAVADENLEKILQQVKDNGRTRIMFALKNKTEATEENYKKYEYLKNICDSYGFVECKPIFWNLKLKGIDNFYAYKIKNIVS